MEEVALRAGHEVLADVDVNITQIVGDPRGILGRQLRPHPIHLLNIIIILIGSLIIVYYY
jgi:hypothetical protein